MTALKGEAGLIEPHVLHEVEPLGPVRFHVEFRRLDYEDEPTDPLQQEAP